MRVGVIGVGAHATGNIYPHLGNAGLTLLATCALHQDRAEAAAARWGAAHAFDDAEEMLDSVDLDGVIVCVSPADYAPLIRLCLEAGIAVYCEKPGAPSSQEAAELATLSAETGIPIVVGYMKRFAPSYQRMREIMQQADFGPPSLATFTYAMGQGAFGGDLRTYLIDNPVHHLDLARYLLGELSHLTAHVTELPGFGHAVAAIAKASSGAVCTFNLCTTASWEQRNEYVEVYGRGHAVWVDNVDTCTYRPPTRPEQVWRPNYTIASLANSNITALGLLPELEHFRQVVMNGVTNRSDMANAATTLRLSEELCKLANV